MPRLPNVRNSLEDHDLSPATRGAVLNVLGTLDQVITGTGSQRFPPLLLRSIPEDRSVSLEMRSTQWRLLISIEETPDESGWSFVDSSGSTVFGDLRDVSRAIELVRDRLEPEP